MNHNSESGDVSGEIVQLRVNLDSVVGFIDEALTDANSDNTNDIVETIEIADTDDDTHYNPLEDTDAPNVEQKGNKRELEDDSSSELLKKPRTNSDDDDGTLCPICLDVWSNSGEHRVCSLKCGHLFGHSCLTRWLNCHTGNKRSCPTCKRRVQRNDIRFLFVKKLTAVDTTELENLKQQLNDAIRDKNKLKMELSSLSLQMEQKVTALTQEIERLKFRQLQQSNVQIQPVVNELICFMDKSLEIHADGGCRVVDFSAQSNTLAVSMVSPNPLFAGYGIRKITLNDYKPTAFIPAHNKPIRDLAFKGNMLLSVSLDTKAIIIDTSTNIAMTSIYCGNPLWSCCWDINDSNVFYVGDVRGCVSVYDVRNPGDVMTQLQVEGDGSPVVSLASTPWQAGEAMPFGGLLCCKLNSCWAFEKMEQSVTRFENRPLGLEGPFMSLRYSKDTKHLLVSARPNQRHSYTRHTVCELTNDVNGSVICSTVHTYHGAPTQSLLSRSCLLNMNGSVYAAAHHETDHNVTLWSLKTGHKVGSVPAHKPVLDLCSVKTYNSHYLVSLNEKKLDFFKINKKL